MMLRNLAAAAVAMLTALSGGCGDRHLPQRTLALIDCHLPRLAQTVKCGSLAVPEDRGGSGHGARHIDISVVVLPANTLSPRPDPLFVLAGGPGQAASSIADFAAMLSDVRTTRDIVLVDQRGTGRSSPLDCAAFKPTHDIDAALDIDPMPRAKACATELAKRGIDASQYTTGAFIDDLEDVRHALGYPRINLWGGSYGTRVAQEYLRRHPQVIRSVVLDGVVPPDMIVSLDVWSTRAHAVDAVIAACRQSPACNAAHPDIAMSMAAIESALGPDGKYVTIALPRTGASRNVHLTYDALLASLQPLLYQPEMAALLPEIIARARTGDFTPLAATLAMFDDAPDEALNAALHYSVTCAEDVPRITADRRRRALDGLSGAALAARAIAVCNVWPRGRMPADFATPVASDVPVLLLSGGLDPVTPPAYAAQVAATLGNARSIVAPGFGHIVSSHACVARLIARFVDDAGFDTLPQSCVDFLRHSTRPLLWPDRLEAKP